MQNAATLRTGTRTFAIIVDGRVYDGYRSRAAAERAYYGDVRGLAVETVREILHDHTSSPDEYLYADWAIATYRINADEIRSAR